MATVTCFNETYECATALKGADYVHLLDSNGMMIAAFDGVSDFSCFSITNGSWTTPSSEGSCYMAVVNDDGTVGKGSLKCSDVITKSGNQTINGTLTATKIVGAVYA